MLIKTTFREIKSSLGRYIAILAIVALGVGFFAGLKVMRPAMISTGDAYFKSLEFFDYRLLSTLGFEAEDVEAIGKVDGVKKAAGSINADALVVSDRDSDFVLHGLSITDGVNELQLSEGRMPEAPDECVVDASVYTGEDIGQFLVLSDTNSKDTLDQFKYKKYKIVGTVQSPLFLNFDRGSTSLGNGSVSGFFCIPENGFDVDYYTEIYVKLNTNETIYTEAYENDVKAAETPLTEATEASAARRYDAIIKEAEETLQKEEDKFNDGYQEFLIEKQNAYDKLDASAEKIRQGEADLNTQAKKLAEQKTQLTASKKQLEDGLTQLEAQREQLEANKPYLSPEEYAEAEAALDANEKTLNESLAKVNGGLKQIAQGEEQIATARQVLAKNKKLYEDGVSQADREFAKAEAQLRDGEKELNKAKSEIKKIKEADTYALTRDTNIGYVSYDNDSSIVDSIARVFPIFFFLVAALVCMTTMTRMVDEQRTQIGIFTALGYSNKSVMGMYLFYSGSAATIGSVLGFFAGCYIFPTVIWNAYKMMYDFRDTIDYNFDWKLGLFMLAVALLCAMGATWFSCQSDFRIAPAELIRPKSPKNGKNIFLERIPFIWKRLSFLYKVAFRNVFRYKKRFFMMVLGISGCTALLLTGLGVNDSVKYIADYQYEEIVVCDFGVTFKDDQNALEQKEFKEETKEYLKDILFIHEGAVDYIHGKTTHNVKLIVSDGENIEKFIDLHTKTEKISYPKKDEAVICEKLAIQFDLDVGDQITLRNSDMDTMEVTVSAICQNYVYNYIYVTPETCESSWGYVPDYKTAYVNAIDGAETGVSAAATKTQNIDNVITTAVNNDMRNSVNKMMVSLDAVIILIVLSAGILAFIVLYNLTNINITERIREIATIKVLGFYSKETATYVFREIFFLTGISSLVGLLVGKLLHTFVMTQIRVDMIFFDTRIVPMSYVYSIALTFVFSAIVCFVMYFKLKRVNMTESLKSIE